MVSFAEAEYGSRRLPAGTGVRRAAWQSILYWRINLFDPHRLFNWLGLPWAAAFPDGAATRHKAH